MTDEHLENGLTVACASIKVKLNRVVQKKVRCMFLTELFPQKLNCIALFSFFNYTIFSNNTAITVFDIIAVLFLSLAISIVDKIFKGAARTVLCLLLFGPLLKKIAHPCCRRSGTPRSNRLEKTKYCTCSLS